MIVKENASYVTRDGMYISDRQELETEQGNQMPLCPNNGLFHDKCPTHVSCIMPAVAPGKRKKGN